MKKSALQFLKSAQIAHDTYFPLNDPSYDSRPQQPDKQLSEVVMPEEIIYGAPPKQQISKYKVVPQVKAFQTTYNQYVKSLKEAVKNPAYAEILKSHAAWIAGLPILAEDGKRGPQTIAAINTTPPLISIISGVGANPSGLQTAYTALSGVAQNTSDLIADNSSTFVNVASEHANLLKLAGRFSSKYSA